MSELATTMAEGGYSMMPAPWLDELYELAGLVKEIPGAIVECGAYNGGSAVMLAAGAGMAPRDVWLFDSWEGLPAPGKFDGDRARQRWDEAGGKLDVGSMTRVRKAFREASVAQPPVGKGRLHLERGWFYQTIPAAETGPIALLHVDADWYKCVRQGLQFYGAVVSGGLVIVHDYWCWPGTYRAVNELLHGLSARPELGKVAKVGCWWRK